MLSGIDLIAGPKISDGKRLDGGVHTFQPHTNTMGRDGRGIFVGICSRCLVFIACFRVKNGRKEEETLFYTQPEPTISRFKPTVNNV